MTCNAGVRNIYVALNNPSAAGGRRRHKRSANMGSRRCRQRIRRIPRSREPSPVVSSHEDDLHDNNHVENQNMDADSTASQVARSQSANNRTRQQTNGVPTRGTAVLQHPVGHAFPGVTSE